METIMIVALIALLILISFCAGVWIGVKLTESRSPSVQPDEPSAEEQRRLMEDQRAFEDLLHYNTDVVYGSRSGIGGGLNEPR